MVVDLLCIFTYSKTLSLLFYVAQLERCTNGNLLGVYVPALVHTRQTLTLRIVFGLQRSIKYTYSVTQPTRACFLHARVLFEFFTRCQNIDLPDHLIWWADKLAIDFSCVRFSYCKGKLGEYYDPSKLSNMRER